MNADRVARLAAGQPPGWYTRWLWPLSCSGQKYMAQIAEVYRAKAGSARV